MSTLAETVESSISELERLTALGVISEDLSHHLLAVMTKSRTGRLFGHDSAVSYPKKILEMTEACSTLLNKDGCNFDEIKTTMSEKFAARKRKPTDLIRIISEVVDHISEKPSPSVLTYSGPVKQNWFFSMFKK